MDEALAELSLLALDDESLDEVTLLSTELELLSTELVLLATELLELSLLAALEATELEVLELLDDLWLPPLPPQAAKLMIKAESKPC